jgi:hypothetical protein
MKQLRNKLPGACRLRSQLCLLASAGILCQSQMGCVYRDQEGQSPNTPPNPSTRVFDYKVTTLDAATTFASGCGATGSGNDLSNSIVGRIPLGTEYLVELTNERAITGALSTNGEEYFCSALYETTKIVYTNSTCYRSVSDSGAELFESSLLSSTGEVRTSSTTEISGNTTDIERFHLKALSPGPVTLTSDGPPCNGSKGHLTLLTISS